MSHPNNFTARRGQMVISAALGIGYNQIFKICGPTPRVPRLGPRKRGVSKYPDEAVREARKMYDSGMFPTGIARAMQKTYPGLPASWVRSVIDGVIRGDVT